jgi:hypothetical protein
VCRSWKKKSSAAADMFQAPSGCKQTERKKFSNGNIFFLLFGWPLFFFISPRAHIGVGKKQKELKAIFWVLSRLCSPTIFFRFLFYFFFLSRSTVYGVSVIPFHHPPRIGRAADQVVVIIAAQLPRQLLDVKHFV